VEDVVQAIAMLLQQKQNGLVVFEFGGPYVYCCEDLFRTVANAS
jgi:hypothetical protein